MVRALTVPPTAMQALLVASRDLPSGTVLAADDLTLARFSPESVPPGAVSPDVVPIGRVLAGPLGQGEALTHVRLVGDALLDGYPGRAVTPVRVSDAGTLPLLEAGMRIDLLGADPATGLVRTLAIGAQVVAVPTASTATPGSGGLLLVAVAPDEADRIAAATVGGYISWVLAEG